MKKVGVIDYGTGNLRSVVKAFEFIGAEVTMVCRPEDAAKIEALVFPVREPLISVWAALLKLDWMS